MPLPKSKNKTLPDEEERQRRRNWGARLKHELSLLSRDPKTGEERDVLWLGRQVGYSNPGSMRQVVNGHQSISLEVFNKILELVPEMRGCGIEPPTMHKEHQGKGAYGDHKEHDYPKLGPKEERRPK